MSTTANKEPVLPTAPEPPADPAHSDLVTRLVAEAFAEFSRPARQVTALPSAPAGLSTAAGLPEISTPAGAGDVPPVHPSAQPEAPKLAPTEETKSGGHTADSEDSYAYGEPRCNGNLLHSKKPETKKSAGPPWLGLAETESATPPGFYFLRGSEGPGGLSHPAAGRSKTATPVPSFDVDQVRRDFPALHQHVNGRPLIWLDNAATTHKPQSVIEATSHFYSRDNSNIHRAAHTLAARSTELFEAGREKVRKFLGAGDAKEIVFVRGTTEAINLVAQSYGRKHIRAGDEIILTELEHHANIVPWLLRA